MLCTDCKNLVNTSEKNNHEQEEQLPGLIHGICISCGKRIPWDERLCTDCKKPIVAASSQRKRRIRGRYQQLFGLAKKNDYKA